MFHHTGQLSPALVPADYVSPDVASRVRVAIVAAH